MKAQPAESVLVGRARDGDQFAYEQLVAIHQRIALRTAYLIIRDAGEAEDIVQEAFIKAYRALARFHRGAPFRPWLLKIVTNEARDRWHAAGRRGDLAARVATQAPTEQPEASPESAVLGSEQTTELLAAVDRLKEIDQLVVACRYFLDLSEAETANVLGCPAGTVKSRLSRALARLREESEYA